MRVPEFEEHIMVWVLHNTHPIPSGTGHDPFSPGVWLEDLYAQFIVYQRCTIRDVAEVLDFLGEHQMLIRREGMAKLTRLGRNILVATQELRSGRRKAQNEGDKQDAEKDVEEDEKGRVRIGCDDPDNDGDDDGENGWEVRDEKEEYENDECEDMRYTEQVKMKPGEEP